MKWPDGAIYEGHWAENKAKGKGKFIHPNGDTCNFYYLYNILLDVGEFSDNKANGYG
jgi:hypothetical protein